MATIFPLSASVGQEFEGYIYDGTIWNIIGVDLTENYLEESAASSLYLTQSSASSTYATVDYVDAEISNIDLTGYATESFANTAAQTASAAAVTYLVDGAPNALNTLNELAAALNDDESFATTVTNSLASKLDASSASATYAIKNDPEFTDSITIAGSGSAQLSEYSRVIFKDHNGNETFKIYVEPSITYDYEPDGIIDEYLRPYVHLITQDASANYNSEILLNSTPANPEVQLNINDVDNQISKTINLSLNSTTISGPLYVKDSNYEQGPIAEGYQQRVPVTSAITSNYTITGDDAGKLLQLNGTLQITIPEDYFFSQNVGAQVNLLNIGTGTVTVRGEPGIVTLNGAYNTITLGSQWSAATIVKIGSEAWAIFGKIV